MVDGEERRNGFGVWGLVSGKNKIRISALTKNPQRATYSRSQEHTPHRKRSPPLERGSRIKSFKISPRSGTGATNDQADLFV